MNRVRRMRRSIYTLFLTMLMGMMFLPYCGADEILTFGGVPRVPPFSFKEDDVAKGFFPDLFRQIVQHAGVNATIKLYPFKRLNQYLQTGKIDGAISIFHKKEREAYLIYSASPILISRTLVFTKKGKEFPFDSIADLYGKQIGTLAGWSIRNKDYDVAKNEGKFVVSGAQSYDQNINKLMADRVDCMISTDQLTWFFLNKRNLTDDIVALEKAIDRNVTYIAISKKTKNILDTHTLMRKLNAAHTVIQNDGTYKQLLRKYGLRNIK